METIWFAFHKYIVSYHNITSFNSFSLISVAIAVDLAGLSILSSFPVIDIFLLPAMEFAVDCLKALQLNNCE